jgi:hypothetical protein
LGWAGSVRDVLLIEELEVAPVIEDQELGLVLARPEQIAAQPGAAPDHLPELHVGPDRLGEHQVDDLGDVDAGVEHVDRDRDRQIVGRVLEVGDEVLGARLVVVDDLAEGRAVLRVQLGEHVGQVDRVVVVAGEHDGLADAAAGGVAQAVVHEGAPHVAGRGAVEQQAIELAGLELGGRRLAALGLERVLLLGVHGRVLEAGVAELAGEGQDPKRHEVLAGDGLGQAEVRGRIALGATEVREGVAADVVDRGRGEADLQRVEVQKQGLVLVVDAAVRLVGDDQVEEADVEVLVAGHHRRVGGEVDAGRLVAAGAGADHDPGLARQVVLEHVVGLAAQLDAVAQEQHALGPAGAQEHLDQRQRDPGLAGAGGLDQERLAEVVREPIGDPLDRLELVDAIGDR